MSKQEKNMEKRGEKAEKQPKKRKNSRKLLFAVLLIWILGSILILVGDGLWMAFVHSKMNLDIGIQSVYLKYWNRYDQIFGEEDPSELPESDNRFYTVFLTMFQSEDTDFEKTTEVAKQYETFDFETFDFDFDTDIYDSPVFRYLFSGFRRYEGIVITDKDGNVIKGVDTIPVEREPCPGTIRFSDVNLMLCRDKGIGLVDPRQTFTPEERKQIAEIEEQNPYVSVVSDRYVVLRQKNIETAPEVYLPLSVTVIDHKDDSVLLELDLSRNAEGYDEKTVRTERIYFHNPKNQFKQRSDFQEQQEEKMYDWITAELNGEPSSLDQELRFLKNRPVTDYDNFTGTGRKELWDGSDYCYQTKGMFVPVRTYRSVYKGNSINVYAYGYTDRTEAYLRIFLSIWGLFTLFCLLLLLPKLFRVIRKKKEDQGENGDHGESEDPANAELENGDPKRTGDKKSSKKKKSKKKLWFLIGGGCLAVLGIPVAAFLIIFLPWLRLSVPESKAPASVPAGHQVVWRKTREYTTTTIGLQRLTGKMEYDEYGRCVKEEYYTDSEHINEVSDAYFYDYDDSEFTTLRRYRFGAVEASDQRGTKFDSSGEVLSESEYLYSHLLNDHYISEEKLHGIHPITGENTVVAELQYNEDGRVYGVEGIIYDPETGSSYKRFRSLTSDIKLFLNYDGDWQKLLSTDTDRCILEEIVEDSPEEHMVRVYSVDKEGNQTLTEEYRYEERSDEARGDDGSEDSLEWTETYDEEGHLTERTSWFATYRYQYDEYGNMIKESKSDYNGSVETKTYVYTPLILKEEDAEFGERFYQPDPTEGGEWYP